MLELAIKIAGRSTCKRYKTGAVIVDRNGEIVSTGWSHHSSNRRLVETPWSTHAEAHAISRAAGRMTHTKSKPFAGCTIYIAQLTSKGTITSGKPCGSCARRLHSLGFKAVVHTERQVFG